MLLPTGAITVRTCPHRLLTQIHVRDNCDNARSFAILRIFVFLFKLVAAMAIFAFFLYELSLFALRHQQPDLPRPLRAIGYPVLPALVCLLDLGLLIAFLVADPERLTTRGPMPVLTPRYER